MRLKQAHIDHVFQSVTSAEKPVDGFDPYFLPERQRRSRATLPPAAAVTAPSSEPSTPLHPSPSAAKKRSSLTTSGAAAARRIGGSWLASAAECGIGSLVLCVDEWLSVVTDIRYYKQKRYQVRRTRSPAL